MLGIRANDNAISGLLAALELSAVTTVFFYLSNWNSSLIIFEICGDPYNKNYPLLSTALLFSNLPMVVVSIIKFLLKWPDCKLTALAPELIPFQAVAFIIWFLPEYRPLLEWYPLLCKLLDLLPLWSFSIVKSLFFLFTKNFSFFSWIFLPNRSLLELIRFYKEF